LKGLVVRLALLAVLLVEALLAYASELFAGEPGVVGTRGHETGDFDDAPERLVVGHTILAALLANTLPADAQLLFESKPGVVGPRGNETGNTDDALGRLAAGRTARAELLAEALLADAEEHLGGESGIVGAGGCKAGDSHQARYCLLVRPALTAGRSPARRALATGNSPVLSILCPDRPVRGPGHFVAEALPSDTLVELSGYIFFALRNEPYDVGDALEGYLIWTGIAGRPAGAGPTLSAGFLPETLGADAGPQFNWYLVFAGGLEPHNVGNTRQCLCVYPAVVSRPAFGGLALSS
jgi:hypothetical protein